MKQEETSELLFTRLRQPQTLTALLCFVSHFARIAVEEKGPDRIIRQGWSFVANISTNPKFHGWMRHLRSHPMSQRIRNRFKIRQLREVRKGEKMAEVSPHPWNIQHPTANSWPFFIIFPCFLHVFGCAVLWRTTGSGMGWPTIRSGT